jgi:hypothetical protein
MQQFTVSPVEAEEGSPPRWRLDVNGALHRHYTTEWAAVIAAFAAAHDATKEGDEASIIMHTAVDQTWSFELTPHLRQESAELVAAGK